MSLREQGTRGTSSDRVQSEEEKKDKDGDYGKLADPNAKPKKQTDNDPAGRNSTKDRDNPADEKLKDAPDDMKNARPDERRAAKNAEEMRNARPAESEAKRAQGYHSSRPAQSGAGRPAQPRVV